MSVPPATNLLLLCDEASDLEGIAKEFEAQGFTLEVFHDIDAALRELERGWACAVVCDDPGRTRLDGFLRHRPEELCTIGVVRQGDVASTVRAMQLGASSVLEMRPGEHLPSVSSLAAAIDEVAARPGAPREPREVVVRAPDSPINSVLDVLPQIARSDAPVLITGESGTGKDLFARLIHELGPRAQGPFVVVNCSAIPKELLEAELFGHVEGAFTGAAQARAGQFEAAHGGTIFLDEIGEVPVHVQVKLLRVLQDRMVLRLGSTSPKLVDFRIVAATNRDLEVDIEQGRFREDLYYRVGVLPIHLPALRERPQDIPVLAEHFIAAQNAQHGTDLVDMTREVRTLFKRYEWPGNIRELQNIIERICILKQVGFIERDDLPPHLLDTPPSPGIGLDVPSEGIDMTDTLERLENRLLTRALEKAEGNKARAARLLGINRTTLVEKLKRKQISLDER